jgi:hypothetical protein
VRVCSPASGSFRRCLELCCKVPMALQENYFETDLRVLAEGVSFALVSALVPKLANTILVQLLGDGSSKASFSLYVVYREGSTTFEVTSKVEVAPSALSVERILRIFVKGTEFKAAILAPLVLAVREHFSALPGPCEQA